MRDDDIQEFHLASASAAEFADALFNRHVATTEAEKNSLTRPIDIDPWYDRVGSIDTFTRLFEAFGVVSAPYSVEQIEQGLWFVNGDRTFSSRNFPMTASRCRMRLNACAQLPSLCGLRDDPRS